MELPHPGHGNMSRDELVLYTLIHAGVDPSNETFAALADKVVKSELKHTYCVALQAMALEALDRKKYQGRIAQCAQFLIDNQCTNGQWSYGKPVPTDTKTPTTSPGKKSGSTEAMPVIPLKKRDHGPSSGDNSNSQYAALGLRACLDASIRFPESVLADAEKWWEKSQNKDGGWSYGTQPSLGEESYGSMTAGGVACLIIYKHYLKKGYAKAPSVLSGIKWMAANFSITELPKGDKAPTSAQMDSKMWHYYWLYALERAGILYGTEKFGTHEWYPEGVEFLLKEQRKDGTWSSGSLMSMLPGGGPDTCFAILFLRRATKPVKDIPTEDPRTKK